jgi:hypothetical protein
MQTSIRKTELLLFHHYYKVDLEIVSTLKLLHEILGNNKAHQKHDLLRIAS